MSKVKILSAVLMIITLCAGMAPASPAPGGAVLKIDVGARPSAMGGAYTAVRGGALSLYWNAAGMSRADSPQFSMTQSPWIEKTFFSNYSALIPFLGGAAGIGASVFSAGSIRRYDFRGDASGGFYRPLDISVTLGYARDISGFSVGGALKRLTSRIDDYRASSFSADAGIMKEAFGTEIGVSVMNIGGELRFLNEPDPMPLLVRAGLSRSFALGEMEFLAAADAVFPEWGDFRAAGGLSAGYAIGDTVLSLSAGVKSKGRGLDDMSRLSAGFGLRDSKIGFDYAIGAFAGLGAVHRLTVTYTAGR